MDNWIVLVISLPTATATPRMRAWRSLKACGAAVLRDGVYLLPALDATQQTFAAISADVIAAGGTAQLLQVLPAAGADFRALFDRASEYRALLAGIAAARAALAEGSASAAQRQARKWRKSLAATVARDFFPGAAREQAETALAELEAAAARALAPGEPQTTVGEIARLRSADHQGRTWATRRRPWVDRLASGWLIRRRIDPHARILWLADPAQCPADALGFDFDGARFTHVGTRVSFEVLLASFGLEDAALARIAALVHYLDVGGVAPPEAAGVASVLAGMRATIDDDDALLAAASGVFDGLLASFDDGARES